jgi:hypothetical protein
LYDRATKRALSQYRLITELTSGGPTLNQKIFYGPLSPNRAY